MWTQLSKCVYLVYWKLRGSFSQSLISCWRPEQSSAASTQSLKRVSLHQVLSWGRGLYKKKNQQQKKKRPDFLEMLRLLTSENNKKLSHPLTVRNNQLLQLHGEASVTRCGRHPDPAPLTLMSTFTDIKQRDRGTHDTNLHLTFSCSTATFSLLLFEVDTSKRIDKYRSERR